MPELQRKLIWLMTVRVLVVASLLLPYLLFVPFDVEAGNPLAVFAESVLDLFGTGEDDAGLIVEPSEEGHLLRLLVAFVSLQTLLYVGLLRFGRARPELQAWIQIGGDLVLITALILRFGGSTPNLSILYFAPIGVASFLLRRRSAALRAAAIAAVLYAGTLFLQQLQSAPAWLRPVGEEASGVPLPYNLFVHVIGFFLVAFFTDFLSHDQALERKLEERNLDLQRLQTLYEDVVQSISSGILVTDLSGIVTNVNRAACEILGRSNEEMLGHSIDAVAFVSAPHWSTIIRRVDRSTDGDPLRSELQIDRHGDPVHVGYSVAQLRDTANVHRGYIVIFQDLTAWHLLQERVRDQDKMAAIGQMAAGLAHEVGNPLAAISGSVQMLHGSLAAGSSERQLLEIVLRESRRLDRTVKSFLQFARPRDHHPEPFDIGALLRETVELLRNSEDIDPDHVIELILDPPEQTLVADRDQIAQLFWNLSRNSLRAMQGGGRLRITGTSSPMSYRLEVADTGHGMSAEERAELFQPFKSFFDSGLGLGMAIVYRVVEEHGGEIHVDSTPGRGTRITIDLPAYPTEAATGQVSTALARSIARKARSETAGTGAGTIVGDTA